MIICKKRWIMEVFSFIFQTHPMPLIKTYTTNFTWYEANNNIALRMSIEKHPKQAKGVIIVPINEA